MKQLYRVGVAVQRAFQGPVEELVELTLANSETEARGAIRDRYRHASNIEIYAIQASTY